MIDLTKISKQSVFKVPGSWSIKIVSKEMFIGLIAACLQHIPERHILVLRMWTNYPHIAKLKLHSGAVYTKIVLLF